MLHKNLTPFFWGPKATARRPREVEMAVCVRGVFRLAPGEPLAPIEDAIAQGFMSGERWAPDDPDKKGPAVRHDDFADWKPKADLLLRGTCHPPRRGDVVCDVAFGVGAWSKTLRVHGPRTFTPGLLFGGTVSEPRPFEAMPLTWENAYGGPGFPDNPAGRGHVGPELPTVEDPRAPVTRVGQRAAPATFLPVSSLWPARWGKTGKNYGKQWEATRAPFVSDDFDWSFYNAAPPDQQVEHLRGDEVVWFQHLHPRAPRFEVRLPALRLRAVVKRRDGTVHDLKFALDTLFADTDAGRLELLWRAHCPVTQLDLSDVQTVLLASEPLASTPLPGAHYLALLEAFEADPVGMKDKLPPGFMAVAEAVQAAEKAELEGGPKPDFAAVAKAMPAGGPIPAWAVAALGTLDDPLATLRGVAGALGIPLPADPAALAALGERMKQTSQDPDALATHLEALGRELGPEQGRALQDAAAKVRAAKGLPPAAADPATTLEALAGGLPPEAGAGLRQAAATLRKSLADAQAAAAQAGPEAEAKLAEALAAAAAPVAPAAPAPPPPLPVQLAAIQAQLVAAARQAGPDTPPAIMGGARDAATQLAQLPGALDAEVGRALAPLAGLVLPPPPDPRAIAARAVAGLAQDEAHWRRKLGDHPLLGVFALARRVSERAGEQVARAKGLDAKAVAGGVGAAAAALGGLGVSAAALAPLRAFEQQLGAFVAGVSGAPWPPEPPRDLAGQDLSRRDLTGLDLAGRCFAGAKLTGSVLVGARLAGADLTGADLEDADLSRADLSRADLRGAKLGRARLAGADLTGAQLSDADLAKADLTGARGQGVVLRGASLDGACLAQAALPGADLTGALLPKARAPGVDLTGAVLEQAIALQADLSGARLAGARLAMADLSKADLTGADLAGADLAMASFGKVKGERLVLRGASFDMCHLDGSRLRGADLREARATLGGLAGCDLTGADLRGIRLHKTTLAGATLDEADLSGAVLELVSLRDVKATRARFVGAKAPGASATGEAAFRACDLRRLEAPRSTWFGVLLEGCDFSHADLSHALMQDLRATDTSFFAARMKQVVLRKAKLRRVRLVRADLGKAELVGAELLDVQLTGANLWDAKFIEATLASCDFLEASLARARFDRAQGEVPA